MLSHYQNFLYVIQSYEVIGHPWDRWVAHVFPWIELILGVFVILGLWTKWGLRGLLVLTMVFMGVVGQALLRNLPINECGCFGALFSVPLSVVILIDSFLWVLIAQLIIHFELTSRFSLDQHWSSQ